MHPSSYHDLARLQIAERLNQAEQSRLRRQVRAVRAPRRQLETGWKVRWLSPWLARPARTV